MVLLLGFLCPMKRTFSNEGVDFNMARVKATVMDLCELIKSRSALDAQERSRRRTKDHGKAILNDATALCV